MIYYKVLADTFGGGTQRKGWGGGEGDEVGKGCVILKSYLIH